MKGLSFGGALCAVIWGRGLDTESKGCKKIGGIPQSMYSIHTGGVKVRTVERVAVE